MTTNPNSLVPWLPPEPISLPGNAQPPEIVPRAALLNDRDQKALVLAFDSGAYEMAATFVWTKAMSTLKKQLADLGMEFVGEMLGRTDLTELSNPITDLREDEAIELAERLGMISTTEAIRLGNAQALITHFSDPEVSRNEQMFLEEAVSILRSCVVNFWLLRPRNRLCHFSSCATNCNPKPYETMLQNCKRWLALPTFSFAQR